MLPTICVDALAGLPEGLDGINFCGATGGQVAGEQGDQQEQEWREDEGGQIERANSVQHSRHQAREYKSGKQADCNAGDRKDDSLANYEAQDVGLFGAEREADSEFLLPLRD